MRRRLFLGAAAASPVMAKQAAGSLAGAVNSPDMLSGNWRFQGGPAMPEPERPDFRKRLAGLSLNDTREKIMRRMRAAMYERRLMSMRSLSQSSRDRMVAEYQAQVEYNDERSRLLRWIEEAGE